MDTLVGHGHPVPVATHFCAGHESPVNIDYSDILPGDDAPDPPPRLREDPPAGLGAEQWRDDRT